MTSRKIRVRRPLPMPRELAVDLRITAPGRGETFIAQGATAVVHASSNRPDGSTWFLNGKLEGRGRTQRLVLPPGAYELNCIDTKGSSSTVTFTVCSSAARAEGG